MRFLLVDRLTRMEVGRSVEGHTTWSLSEDVFEDHFPGVPIVPGVLLVEAMAQMAGFLLARTYKKEYGDEHFVGAILSIIHKAKFRRTVAPGDRVDMHADLTSFDRKRASCRAKASVDGQLRAEAVLSFVWHVQPIDEAPPELLTRRASYERFVFAGLDGEASGA